MARPPRSPLAPAAFPAIPPVDGVRFATAVAGVRYQGRRDVMLADIVPGAAMAGVFTQSATRAAPVLWCEAALAASTPGPGFAILVNAGNANAFTGQNGLDSTQRLADATAAALDVAPERVFLSSTGVIGEPLPDERIRAVLGDLKAGLSPDGIAAAAEAIMTTDTYPKGAYRGVTLQGVPVTLAGIAKGSGMIAPDMATMLAYVFTDAAVAPDSLQAMTARAAARTFNCITVDSDTSTSDTVLVAATGAVGGDAITATDPRAEALETALTDVMRDLAHQIVRDGEGATKFAEITVRGARTDRSAHRVAMAVANSPLVKTALAGEDPNWGRIVMAIGKAGEPVDRDKIAIAFGNLPVAEAGWVSPHYDEAKAAAYMKQSEIGIDIALGVGPGTATVWTCDLTHAYISINADYRS
ncbi:MAG: bifunctional glutamate N-acetyltransferase/amino-acid acetyltransferase ArgJ [Pseudomonadota bacterium]